MSELLPCPFCGSTNLTFLRGGPTLHDAIKCHPCNLYVPLTIAEWNRRSSAGGGAEPVAWMVKDKVTGKLWSCVEEPQIPTSQIERYEYFPLVYAHSSVAGMPDEIEVTEEMAIEGAVAIGMYPDGDHKSRAARTFEAMWKVYVRAIGGA